MPLIDLQTDLKSLRYGNDRPGGGSSGLPYVVSPLPQDVATPFTIPGDPTKFYDFYELNKSTSDYPIRGGSIGLDGASGRFTTPAGQIDLTRIKAFMDDPQRGKIFILKQTGLQLTNPKMQVPGTIASFNADPIRDFLETTRVYNPTAITTLQQVLASGTGTHIPRHGLIPSYFGFFNRAYQEYVIENNEEYTNRLTVLARVKLAAEGPFTSRAIGKVADYGISLLNDQILSYPGGPGSVYGVGQTIVKRATNTNNGKVYDSIAYTYDSIQNQETTKGFNRAHPKVQDFRSTINSQVGKQVQPEANYNNRAYWYNKTGNPGATPLATRVDYTNNTGQGDPVNMSNVYYYDTQKVTPWTIASSGINNDDIIKFAFECLSNDQVGYATALVFRAFLANFSDSHQANFNTFNYLGRGETFRVYQGFDRTVSFSFKIAAFSREEMKPLYTKLNHLISQVYPDYAPDSRFMRGNIIRLTIGDYMYRVPGFLNNVNITVDDNTSWEIALDEFGADKDMRELPQVISVQCTFNPIHDFLPRKVTPNSPYVPLIANTETPYLDQNYSIDRELTTPQANAQPSRFNMTYKPPDPPIAPQFPFGAFPATEQAILDRITATNPLLQQ